MTSNKHLLPLQLQIQELLPTLELFLEEDSALSKTTCERLQSQINSLEECLTIYKFNLGLPVLTQEVEGKALSENSFNAKPEPAKEPQTFAIVKETIPTTTPLESNIIEDGANTQKVENTSTIKEQSTSTPHFRPLMVGINDKFRFINELFGQNSPEYSVAIEQINAMSTYNEASNYLTGLKNVYNWQDNNETVKQFYALVKKRYS